MDSDTKELKHHLAEILQQVHKGLNINEMRQEGSEKGNLFG